MDVKVKSSMESNNRWLLLEPGQQALVAWAVSSSGGGKRYGDADFFPQGSAKVSLGVLGESELKI